jgi:hypothetical protein
MNGAADLLMRAVRALFDQRGLSELDLAVESAENEFRAHRVGQRDSCPPPAQNWASTPDRATG